MDAAEVQATLAAYRQLVQDEMVACLSAGAHTRYLNDLLPLYPRRAGKGLRGALVLAVCRAMGGRADDALPIAVGVELLHNAFLIHDDLADGSRRRRGEPTLPFQYGRGLALCAGDALAVRALAVLAEAADTRHLPVRDVVAEVERATRSTIEGQAIELGWDWEGRLDVEPEDYLDMVLRKTSWYTFILPSRLAMLAARRGPLRNRFFVFGALAGAVLQIGDDLSSYITDRHVSGKDWGDDVIEGKRSLPVIHFLRHAPDGHDKAQMRALLSAARGRRKRRDACWFIDLLRRQGSLAYAYDCLVALAEEARLELDLEMADAVDEASVDFIQGLLTMLVSRCAAAASH
jgi:geranylgeranyl diphosphate synthase type II